MFRSGKRRIQAGRALALAVIGVFALTASTASARTTSEAASVSPASAWTLGVSEELFSGNITVCDTTEGGNNQAEQVLSDGFMPDADWHTVSVNWSKDDAGLVSWTSAEAIEILVIKQGNGGVAYKFDPTQSSGQNQSKFGSGEPSGGVSHVVGCARVTTPPPPSKGTLRVVKAFGQYVPEGITADDFSFTLNGELHAFEADGTNEFQVDPGTFNVVETVTGGASVSYDGCTDIKVDAGQIATCTITNTFTPPTPGEVTITKTAAGRSGRVVDWTISKSGALTTPASKNGNGTITWNVEWTKSATEGYSVAGSIVVQNGLESALDGATLTDELGGEPTEFSSLDCEVDGSAWSQGSDIPAGETLTCEYVLLFDSKPEADENVAVVDWEDGTEKSDPASFSFPETEPALEEVVVNDPRFDYSQTVDESGSHSFTEPVTCAGGSFSNTATLNEPGEKGDQVATSGEKNVQVGAVDCSTTPPVDPPTTPPTTPTPPTVPPVVTPPVVTPPVVTPPVVKPPVLKPPVTKPSVRPAVCLRLAVAGRKIVSQGARTTIAFKVSQAGKPKAGVAVLLRGAGIYRVAKTNGQGIVRLTVLPAKSGIVSASISPAAKGCNLARIGVLGVFEPPVTG